MSFNISTVVEPDFVRINSTGEYTFEDLFDFIRQVKVIADKVSRNKILIDCSRVANSMTEAERFAGGQKIAETFGSRLRAAIVMPAGQVTKLGELAAANRGAVLLVTESETEALAWLAHT
jgi:hypothetical protein